MGKAQGNANPVWNTQYGPRRVRIDLPTLQEAVFAAQGLTDDENEQIEIAAALIGASEQDVRAEIARSKTLRQVRVRPRGPSALPVEPRSFVVEKKISRRPVITRPVIN
jgi:hypothetical protein